jgi:hypothetical protein
MSLYLDTNLELNYYNSILNITTFTLVYLDFVITTFTLVYLDSTITTLIYPTLVYLDSPKVLSS